MVGNLASLPLTDQLSAIKVKIHKAVGMPSRKQRSYEDTVNKDSNSLGHHDVASEAPSTWSSTREVGGGKKRHTCSQVQPLPPRLSCPRPGNLPGTSACLFVSLLPGFGSSNCPTVSILPTPLNIDKRAF